MMAEEGNRLMNEFATEFNPYRVIQNYAADRTVAILIGNATGKPAVGSGVCIRIADRFFLATAGHTIEEVHDTKRILLVPPRAQAARLRVLDRGYSVNDLRARPDFGWIEVAPDDVGDSGLRALALSDLELSALPGTTPVLVTGYPLAMVQELGSLPRLCCTGLLTMPATDASHSGDSSSEILIEYPPHNDPIADDVPFPHGMSGGGVWTVPRYEDHPIWSAERMRLIGVARAWDKAAQTLYAIPIRLWLDFLGREKPELRSMPVDPPGERA